MLVSNEASLPHVQLAYSPYLLASWAWEDDGFDACMDNLKVYSYAKTSFVTGDE